ncbi:MAG: hypothetical protein ACAH17_03500 [Candidatus Paceibacterota bacterium]
MLITVIKRNELGERAVEVTKRVISFEDFAVFTLSMGIQQNFEEMVQDFTEGNDRTYILPLEYYSV